MEQLMERYWMGQRLPKDSVSPKTNPICNLHKFYPDLAFLLTFANVAILRTDQGLVLIDVGHYTFAKVIKKRIRTAYPNIPVHTVIYTHGHIDHVTGISAFEELNRIQVVGHSSVAKRFDRYKLTLGYNAAINSKQFNAPAKWPAEYQYPTKEYENRLTLHIGGERLELHHAKGETDDATWVYIPSKKALCTGDFFIWATPNCGNPQKVQRYPLEWSKALREMMKYEAELLLPGHGPPIKGADRVRQALEDTATFLEDISLQALKAINQGKSLAEVVNSVVIPAHLLKRPYLLPVYDDPRFIVRNVWRQYAGWWDQDPAHLLIGHEPGIAKEVCTLAGGPLMLAKRAQALMLEDKLDIAIQLIEWAAHEDKVNTTKDANTTITGNNHSPNYHKHSTMTRQIHAIRADIFKRKGDIEPSLMAKGIYLAAQMQSEKVLDSPAWRAHRIEYRVTEFADRHNLVWETITLAVFIRGSLRRVGHFIQRVLQILGVWTLLLVFMNKFPFEVQVSRKQVVEPVFNFKNSSPFDSIIIGKDDDDYGCNHE